MSSAKERSMKERHTFTNEPITKTIEHLCDYIENTRLMTRLPLEGKNGVPSPSTNSRQFYDSWKVVHSNFQPAACICTNNRWTTFLYTQPLARTNQLINEFNSVPSNVIAEVMKTKEISRRMELERNPEYIFLSPKYSKLAEVLRRRLSIAINKRCYAAKHRILFNPPHGIKRQTSWCCSLRLYLFLSDNVQRPHDQELVRKHPWASSCTTESFKSASVSHLLQINHTVNVA